MSKKCNFCSTINDDNTPICTECGRDEFDIVDSDSPSGKPKISLKNIVSDVSVEVPEVGCLIGRGYDFAPEMFNHKWVSEPHCKISIVDNDCIIEDIGSEGVGSTNGTFLNGDRLPARTPTKFYDGSKIMIAHIMFDVTVEYPYKSCESEENGHDEGVPFKWVIDCPVSGKRFDVENSTSHITECDCCTDPVDKRKIARIRPKQVRV